ncbi:hypothetical protein G3N56_19745 [Desulfovibrio sulfodismutans]|uniref:Uncharacterized protein n=1 Tax=Desulfolutivibrio sulfodismutans TaxID=63561 RepID=A0A7K3NS07_9BACT|nr:hypothetical protein [Desulfolutivibrio sulfodismutans]NDY58976.1 hypothetical protein [Desulfolutivibrio sulfodismutans]
MPMAKGLPRSNAGGAQMPAARTMHAKAHRMVSRLMATSLPGVASGNFRYAFESINILNLLFLFTKS